jgi:hypothetical protein
MTIPRNGHVGQGGKGVRHEIIHVKVIGNTEADKVIRGRIIGIAERGIATTGQIHKAIGDQIPSVIGNGVGDFSRQEIVLERDLRCRRSRRRRGGGGLSVGSPTATSQYNHPQQGNEGNGGKLHDSYSFLVFCFCFGTAR